jgi:MFS family permease
MLGGINPANPGEKPETLWHLALIPLYIAIGSVGLLATLVALSLGASVADIGVMTSTGGLATVVFSVLWGRLSDLSGRRKRFLLFFITLLSPILVAFSMVQSVPQLIVLYALLVCVASGVSPVGIMYTVERNKSKNWRSGVARYSSMTSFGNILGLLVYTVVAQFYETQWLFYISAVMCLFAAILLWRFGQETERARDGHPFSLRGFKDVERFFSPTSIRQSLGMRRPQLPHKLNQLKPLQLLFLAAFVHWIGITFWGVGQTPLMKDLGLSDSHILAINGAAGAAQAIAFVELAPRITSNHKGVLSRIVAVRGGLILCWAALPLLFVHPVSLAFTILLIVSIAWNVFYTMIWLPITTFAIVQAPIDRQGSVQGELLSIIGVSNAIGSYCGGLVITAYGYTISFILASGIVMLTIPIISRVDTD